MQDTSITIIIIIIIMSSFHHPQSLGVFGGKTFQVERADVDVQGSATSFPRLLEPRLKQTSEEQRQYSAMIFQRQTVQDAMSFVTFIPDSGLKPRLRDRKHHGQSMHGLKIFMTKHVPKRCAFCLCFCKAVH